MVAGGYGTRRGRVGLALAGEGQALGNVAVCVFFFFQAEDGIRDLTVTGVQTCALPISTGAYNLYAYSFGTNLNDYPKIGVWPTSTNSAYTATYNLFLNGGPFVGAALCAYDRAAMIAGAASPVSVCYTITNDGGYLPSDLDGSTLPPAGSSGVFLTFETLSSLRYYRSEEHTSNSSHSQISYAVFCLKKKKLKP